MIDKLDPTDSGNNHENESNNMALNKHLLFCMHFYCIKLKKRVDFIKTPSTFCDKDFYSNNFELYSRSIYSSRITPRQGHSQPKTSGNKASATTEQLMNTSNYSTQSVLSSIDSTISSIASSRTPAKSGTKASRDR